MTIVRVELGQTVIGADYEDIYALARDTARGRLFVEHRWVRRFGQGREAGVDEIEVRDFLPGEGPAQTKLLKLLGGEHRRRSDTELGSHNDTEGSRPTAKASEPSRRS